MKKVIALFLAACGLATALGPTTPMPGFMHPGGTSVSGSDINPDSVDARTGVFGSVTDSGPLIMPNQSAGYLVKTPASSTIQSQNCAATEVAGYTGGGSTTLSATIASPSLIAMGGTLGYMQTTTDGVTYGFPAKPNSTTIFSGTYGLGRFIFVGGALADSTTGSTSTDGIVWNSIKGNFTSGNMGAVACSATECVLVGNSSRVMTTTNFTTFTNGTFGGASVTLWGVAYSPSLGMYAAVGASGTIKTSIDGGATWTARTSGVATTLFGIGRSTTAGVFVAVGSGGVILTSEDGVTWTPRTSGTVAALYNAIEGNGVIVVTGDSLKVITSGDGTTWTIRSTGSPSTLELYQSAYLSGTYLVGGQNGVTFKSTDGATWSQVGIVQPGCVSKSGIVSEYLGNTDAKTINGPVTMTGAVSLPAYSEGLFYQPHPDSAVVTIPNGPTGQVLQSRGEGLAPDWENPTAINAFTTGSDFVSNPELADPMAKFIRVTDTTWINNGGGFFTDPTPESDSSRYMRVTDMTGAPWTTDTAIAATNLLGIAYKSADTLVAVGDDRTIRRSMDRGLTWAAAASTGFTNATDDIRAVVWAQSLGLFIATGSLMQISSSPGGSTWTLRQTAGTSGNETYDVAWSGSRLVTMGDNSSDVGRSFYSDNGTSWTSVTITGSAAMRCVTWFVDHWVAGGLSGNIWTSPTAEAASWTQRTTGTPDGSYLDMAHNGTRIVAVGTAGLIRTSDDGGVSWTTRTSGVATTLNSVIWTGFQFIATGATATTIRSFDGITWTSITSGVTLNAITLADSVLFGVGNTGIVRHTLEGYNVTAYGSTANRTAETTPTGSLARAYINQPATMTLAGQFEFDVDGLTPEDLPENFDILRGFKSTAYESNADRGALTDPMGDTMYAYSGTPLVVDIPQLLSFNIAILTPADVPFNFDVVTIQDMIYNLFVVQNSSLSPGPYYGWNAVYDFGVDNRWEFGAESDDQWASLTIQDSDTGDWFIKKSSAIGDAGAPITWVDAFVIHSDGSVTIPDLAGVGTRNVVVDANGKLSAP